MTKQEILLAYLPYCVKVMKYEKKEIINLNEQNISDLKKNDKLILFHISKLFKEYKINGEFVSPYGRMINERGFCRHTDKLIKRWVKKDELWRIGTDF